MTDYTKLCFILKNAVFIRKADQHVLRVSLGHLFTEGSLCACVRACVSLFSGCWEMDRHDWLKVKFSQCL